MLCLLLPVLGVAQSSKGARSQQLSSSALAVVTTKPAKPASKAVVIPVATPEVVTRVFTGTVLDEWNEPIAGAIVTLVSDPHQSGITNAAGSYMLRTTTLAPVLRVTYAGYRDTQVEGNEAGPLLVQLEPIDNYARQLKKTLKSAEKAYRKP
jgi:hypothetical protein